MNEDILFDSGTYQIIAKIEGDPIEWELPNIKSLCVGLLKDEAPRAYFFKGDLRKHYVNGGLRHFFLDPAKSFDATTKSGSNFFEIIECYQNDTDNKLKNFLSYLIRENVVESDVIKLLKCKCGCLTLSAGNLCGHCDYKKPQTERRYSIYYLPDEIKSIFNRPGAIVEGVLFHAIKELEPMGLTVHPNVYLKQGEGKEKQELDLVIINKEKTKILVLLSSISPQDRSEKKQCVVLRSNNIEGIFITTENEKATEGIRKDNELTGGIKIDIFCDIMKDIEFPGKLLARISNYFEI